LKSFVMETTYGVMAVANAVGLSNVSHFRRTFRRHVGINPGELGQTARSDPRSQVRARDGCAVHPAARPLTRTEEGNRDRQGQEAAALGETPGPR
jgi:AraC-like DNA-binding protein